MGLACIGPVGVTNKPATPHLAVIEIGRRASKVRKFICFHNGLLILHTIKHLRIGKKEEPHFQYHLKNHPTPLPSVPTEKDLGITFDQNLHFNIHLSEKINKANSILGIISRNFEHKTETSIVTLYKALVRPHLEYANHAWSLHLKKQIEALENVQRRATRLIPGLKDLTYEQRLRRLKLPTLSYRRLRGDMIETYKIMTGKYDSDVTTNLTEHRLTDQETQTT